MSSVEIDLKICSICLSTGTTHSVLETKHKSLLHSIAPQMKLGITGNSFTCCECMKSLVDLYYFKALYLDCEEKVRERVSETGQKINIIQVVYPSCVLDSDEYIVNICRICLATVETETFSTPDTKFENLTFSEMILSAMPEVILDITSNPIICDLCTMKIIDLYVFMSKCLEIENKIRTYLEIMGTTAENLNTSFLLFSIAECFKETNDNKLSENDCDLSDLLTFNGTDAKRHKQKMHLSKTSKSKNAKSADKRYKCTICNAYATNEKNNLTKHMVRHTKQSSQTFLCSTCDFECNSKFDVKKHTAEQHSEKDNASFTCPKCSYTSDKRRNLSKHLARHRKKEKQTDETQIYKCSTCSFDTKIKYDLKRHMLIHKKPSESVMYKCEVCPYQTNRKDNLSIHSLRHKCQENTSNDEVEN